MNIKLKSFIFTIIIPIVGLAATAWGVYDNFNEREFSYEEKLITTFEENTSEGWPEIKVLFNDNEIVDGGILNLRFKNTGNEAIYSNDFDQPIIVTLDSKSHFLSVRHISSTPNRLTPIYKFNGNKLTIEPTLFNPGNEITIQAVISGTPKIDKILTRIGGIDEALQIEPEEKEILKYFSWALLLYSLIAMMGITILTEAFVNRSKNESSIKITKSSVAIISIVIIMPASIAIGRFLEYQDIYPETWWGLLFIFALVAFVADILSKIFRVKN